MIVLLRNKNDKSWGNIIDDVNELKEDIFYFVNFQLDCFQLVIETNLL